MTPITCVLWHWGQRYSPIHLVKMQSMLTRCLSLPHSIVCITDRPRDVPAGMGVFDVRHTIAPGDFKCIRRMWLYAGPQPKVRPWPGMLGERLLQLDLDMVLTGSLDPLVDRPDPFIIWKGESTVKPNRPHGWAYNHTIMLLTAGARAEVYETWAANRRDVEKAADKDGWDTATNSDQSIATFLLKRNPPAVWTNADGIYAYRAIAGPDGMKDEGLPANCRVVSFHGRSGARTPASPELQARSPWIREHWR